MVAWWQLSIAVYGRGMYKQSWSWGRKCLWLATCLCLCVCSVLSLSLSLSLPPFFLPLVHGRALHPGVSSQWAPGSRYKDREWVGYFEGLPSGRVWPALHQRVTAEDSELMLHPLNMHVCVVIAVHGSFMLRLKDSLCSCNSQWHSKCTAMFDDHYHICNRHLGIGR